MSAANFSKEELNPLQSIEQWEDDVLVRYPEPDVPAKTKEEFRDYDNPQRDTVREFYRLNHTYQTYDFVKEKQKDFLQFNRKKLRVWEALEFLNTLIDDSDPDTDLDQLQHLLQTAEAIREDGHSDWFVLTGFIHDMGKVLAIVEDRIRRAPRAPYSFYAPGGPAREAKESAYAINFAERENARFKEADARFLGNEPGEIE